MRILKFCGPIIKFLINKYASNLESYPQFVDIMNKFNSTKILLPSESVLFVKILQELQLYLNKNNLVHGIDAIQNYVGDSADFEGLLNLLIKGGHEIYICEYDARIIKDIVEQVQETFKDNISDLKVIVPLSLEDIRELYELFIQKLKIPVYPLSNGLITSKWLINFTFSPYTPRTFYFPINTNALDYIEKIRNIAKKENINFFILKDEYDYDLRDFLPYSVSSPEKLDYYCSFFYEKSKGITNVGGLIIEEFLSSNNLTTLYKSLMYDGIVSEFRILNEIKLKPFLVGDFFPSIIDSIKELVVLNQSRYNSFFNSIFRRYYRYIITSIDYIFYNYRPYVIDLNGIVSTLRYLQKLKKKYIDSFFKIFISQIALESNEDTLIEQKLHLIIVNQFYYAIRKLGPSYISGERYINLDTLKERNVKDIIEDLSLKKETN
jgi:hypothetical protein